MSKKINSARRVSKNISAFICPLCESKMRVVEHKSLICTNNHTFDFAKQGYLNLMTQQSNSHYSKELFEARHKIINGSELYDEMHKSISNVIKNSMDTSINPCLIVDLGCGEGSHLQRIIDGCEIEAITGVGLDIAKEGIVAAAKRYENPIWLVGDLAKSPLADHSFYVILNILSPSNYKEFKRMLVQDGLVIKVVPGPNYLKEIREALFESTEKKDYKNDDTISLFKEHFKVIHNIKLNYTKILTKEELYNLVGMTPLAWSGDQDRINAFSNQDSAEITVDLEILVGINK
ncbi:23S rRNA m(1)G-748 methyltransferase [Schinkia azotoformans MEV2011]|uniref:23S rRNA m(1)G-748 methyltransferase n=1 Tax=Schinkia azotoformans MEV2011 TaxID=1348973 RepID=A0A072NLX6_SCHAZ|nr:methyltransferase domain-containing protein [Schinkia azotoformans]KEF37933.1 23S rRNA m(1)G-748 methyltransferase [Schinkia azotoformans MEV2011]MEC1696292.1 methyltransferase domain-containing protein [Schinkia azotoformans]MEC1726797.1 methyltransferase domain-containing protein [Schinkia azotoformans]MEC1770826.1 methyltransferase domain-containing protein [Schinkia azotoformans]MEC1780810.1 methyltransferase domain-containing protein [Schinkia azotoformans]